MRKPLQRYLKPKELAALLSVSYWTVCRQIAAREFPSTINIGSEARPDYRVPLDEVDAWLSRRRVFLERND